MELYTHILISFTFFAAIQFDIEDKHRQPISRYLGSFFLTQELFLVAIYLNVFRENHEPSVPQIGATKRNNLGQLENGATAR